MQQEKMTMFQNRLEKKFRHLKKQAKRLQVSCYRIYDHDLPEFPLCIEIYGDKIYIAEYKRRHGMSDEAHAVWIEQCLNVVASVLTVMKENIFLKLRQRKPGRQGQYQKHEGQQCEFQVEENGLSFIVNLSDYLDTGLFLDHRITRQMVKEQSAGKKVLNLFAYTGSFSVYAASGGATEVVTVDLSKTYLHWAERNMALNQFSAAVTTSFIHADVIAYLKQLPENYYDIIVLDPPTFSNSKRMDDILDIQRDHVGLINNCMQALAPGGLVYFSTNYRKFVMDNEKINAASIQDITKLTMPFDFEGKLGRGCYLISREKGLGK